MTEMTVKPRQSMPEFVALLAACMSLVALSIDSMLPALPEIGASYGIDRANSQQFIITFLFAGLSLGQLLAGPLSDAIGRKRGIYVGFVIFLMGSALSYLAPTFEIMLAGRFLQGLGAAAPRIVTIAMVRDKYEGREMARIMSYIMGVFILVPALAPTIGQGIMVVAGWRNIFLAFIVIATLIFIWLATRLEETLRPEDKRPFTLPVIWSGIKAVCRNRQTACYMIAAGCIFGAFIGYLNSSQQIFQDYYNVGALFPMYFGLIALAIGGAFFTNAQLVRRFGMRHLVLWALIGMASLAVIFTLVEIFLHGAVPLPAFLIYILASAFCMGMLFGNFNALAMIPMGHMAGIASAVIGCVSLVISVTAGSIIGQLYDGNLIPVTGGFLILSLLSLTMMRIAERGTTPG